MADPKSELEALKKSLFSVVEHTKVIEASAGRIGNHVAGISGHVKSWFVGTRDIKEALIQLLPYGNALSETFKFQAGTLGEIQTKLLASRISQENLLEIERHTLEAKNSHNDLTTRGYALALKEHAEAEAARATKEKEIVFLEHQEKLHGLIHSHLLAEGTIGGILFATYKKSLDANAALNSSLIKASSLEEDRFKLASSIYALQLKTGVSFQTATESARALVGVGIQTGDAFDKALKAVVMMHDGLGVSVESGAELARIYQTGLNIPLQKVGDSLANIVNQTSLAGDEAARFAIEIGKAVQLLGRGSGVNAIGLQEFASRFAGALKTVGGNADDFVKAFSELVSGTTSGGIKLRALAGNINAPSSNAEARAGLERITDLVNRIVTAPAGSLLRGYQVKAAADITNLSPDNINNLNQALREMNRQTQQAETLEQRFAQQMKESGQSMKQALNSVVALLHRGMLPLVTSLNYVAQFLAMLAQQIDTTWSTVISGAVLVATALFVTQASRITYQAVKGVLAFEAFARSIAKTTLAAEGAALAQGVTGVGAGKIPFTFAGAATWAPLALSIGYAIGTALDQLFYRNFKWYKDFWNAKSIQSPYHTSRLTDLKPALKQVFELEEALKKATVNGASAQDLARIAVSGMRGWPKDRSIKELEVMGEDIVRYETELINRLANSGLTPEERAANRKLAEDQLKALELIRDYAKDLTMNSKAQVKRAEENQVKLEKAREDVKKYAAIRDKYEHPHNPGFWHFNDLFPSPAPWNDLQW